MGRNKVSLIGNEAAMAAKALTLSLQSRGTCPSFSAERVFNFCLTRDVYFAIRGSLDSNSALTCLITSCESLRNERLSTLMASASSSPTIMASYFGSLLVALKPNRTSCLILSPIGEVNYRPMPAPVCLEAPSTLSAHQPVSSGQVSSCGISSMKSAKTCSFFESLSLYWMPYSLNSIS